MPLNTQLDSTHLEETWSRVKKPDNWISLMVSAEIPASVQAVCPAFIIT